MIKKHITTILLIVSFVTVAVLLVLDSINDYIVNDVLGGILLFLFLIILIIFIVEKIYKATNKNNPVNIAPENGYTITRAAYPKTANNATILQDGNNHPFYNVLFRYFGKVYIWVENDAICFHSAKNNIQSNMNGAVLRINLSNIRYFDTASMHGKPITVLKVNLNSSDTEINFLQSNYSTLKLLIPHKEYSSIINKNNAECSNSNYNKSKSNQYEVHDDIDFDYNEKIDKIKILKKYQELNYTGVLSDEEFEKKRKELLDL